MVAVGRELQEQGGDEVVGHVTGKLSDEIRGSIRQYIFCFSPLFFLLVIFLGNLYEEAHVRSLSKPPLYLTNPLTKPLTKPLPLTKPRVGYDQHKFPCQTESGGV